MLSGLTWVSGKVTGSQGRTALQTGWQCLWDSARPTQETEAVRESLESGGIYVKGWGSSFLPCSPADMVAYGRVDVTLTIRHCFISKLFVPMHCECWVTT